MNCKICGEKLKCKQRSYCCEEHARQGKNNVANSWRYENKEKVLSEYDKNKYFKYIKIHAERVTKEA